MSKKFLTTLEYEAIALDQLPGYYLKEYFYVKIGKTRGYTVMHSFKVFIMSKAYKFYKLLKNLLKEAICLNTYSYA